MNKNLTEIAYILDRSGSMSSVTEAAIAGFNEFLKDQQKTEGQARLTLVLFDNEYLVPFDAIPIQEARPLDTMTYVPRATTALLDAIGTTIDNLGSRLAAIPEPEKPGQVLVAIFTDGLENASVKFTWQDTDLHSREARERGENQQRLDSLPVWRESPFFTVRERAALAWAESITRIAETHAGDAEYQALTAHFSETEIVELSLSVSLANFWNRMAAGFRKMPIATSSAPRIADTRNTRPA